MFYIQYNHFEYLIISFGLINVLTTFQSYIYKTFYKLFDIFYIIYFNNIFIFFKTKQKYTKYIQQML